MRKACWAAQQLKMVLDRSEYYEDRRRERVPDHRRNLSWTLGCGSSKDRELQRKILPLKGRVKQMGILKRYRKSVPPKIGWIIGVEPRN